MIRPRVIIGFLDQGISSLTSLLILAAAAQSLSPHNLGLFSIGLASIVSLVAIIRALTGETLLVRVTSTRERYSIRDGVRAECRKSLGLSFILGLAAGLVISVVAVLWPEPRIVLLSAAAAVFFVVLQDAVRHVCITLKHSGFLLISDITVLTLSVGGILYSGSINAGPELMIGIWGTACFVGSTLVVLTKSLWPTMVGGLKWLRVVWPTSSAFVLEAVLGAIVSYAIVVVLGIFSSPSDVAGYRAAVSVFGVTSLVINFLRTAVMRELTPAVLQDRKSTWKLFIVLSGFVTSATVATFLVVIFMPVSWGELAFGQTWSLIVDLAPYAGINRLAAGICIVPLIFLRVLGVSWEATKVRLVLLIPLCVIAPLFSALGGAPGAFLADAAFYCLTAFVLFILVLRRSPPRALRADYEHEGLVASEVS